MPNQNIFKNVELSRIISALKKKETQKEAAKKLHQYLAQYQEDCDDNLFNHFKSMLDSVNLDWKFGALLAINKVARIGRETRIVHRVRNIMPSVLAQLRSDNKELVESTADCLGVLAEAGGKITAENVDDALKTVLKFLEEDRNPKSTDNKKYSGVLVLREFCIKLPIITFNKLFAADKKFLWIFETLRDHRPHVRTTAAQCINECVRMISERDYQND